MGRREGSILTVSLFGYLKLNNARYNCAIESAARATRGGGVGGAGWLTWECTIDDSDYRRHRDKRLFRFES